MELKEWVKFIGPRMKVKSRAYDPGDDLGAISRCYHSWIPFYGVIFEYITVDAKCEKCKTHWSMESAREEENRNLRHAKSVKDEKERRKRT